MAGIRTCDRESQVQRPNHYTTEPPTYIHTYRPTNTTNARYRLSTLPGGLSLWLARRQRGIFLPDDLRDAAGGWDILNTT